MIKEMSDREQFLSDKLEMVSKADVQLIGQQSNLEKDILLNIQKKLLRC